MEDIGERIEVLLSRLMKYVNQGPIDDEEKRKETESNFEKVRTELVFLLGFYKTKAEIDAEKKALAEEWKEAKAQFARSEKDIKDRFQALESGDSGSKKAVEFREKLIQNIMDRREMTAEEFASALDDIENSKGREVQEEENRISNQYNEFKARRITELKNKENTINSYIEIDDKEKAKLEAKIEILKYTPLYLDKAKSNGVTTNQSAKRLPIRSFWEIYNSTCTEHVGSVARNINKLAHMKVFPPKNEDIVHKALNAILTVVKVPTKLIAKIPNAIMGTDNKIDAMRENIDKLTPEEFQVLVESPEKANSMFNGKVKDEFDRDYLEPQFMKQYKVNNAYLDVVRERLGRERGTAIQYYRDQAEEAYQKIQEIDQIDKIDWTEEQKNEYNKNIEIYQQCVEEGKKLQAELDIFDEGAKKKSSAYRNISGWFLAKFNPDNRAENARMAILSQSRRIAGSEGNLTEVNTLTGRMQSYLRANTDIRGGEKNYIDIGRYSIESPVETLDRGPQTKGRLLLTNIAIISSVVGLYNQIRDNEANREIVEMHNKQLSKVNEANKNFKVTGEAKVSDSPDAPQAEETIARQTVEAGWNRAERGDLDATNWSFNSTYRQRDLNSHTEGAEVANSTNEILQQGDQLRALENAIDYYTRVQNANRTDIQNYIPTHPQYDYTAFEFGDSIDMSKIYDFFANGVVPYETTINGVMADLMPALREGVDINGIIFAGANALYQAQREGKKDSNRQEKEDFKQSLQVSEDSENSMNALQTTGIGGVDYGGYQIKEALEENNKNVKTEGSRNR